MGYSILESYSRILESLAFTVMSRIEDVLRADSLAQDPGHGNSKKNPSKTDSEQVTGTAKSLVDTAAEETEKLNKLESNGSMTLSDFMEWEMDQDTETKEEEEEEESGNLD